ncbi:MAG: DUF6279 family lipoprotein [Burkholderiaceae bacterium]
MRRWIIGLACAALLAAAGCSFVRLGYNQAPALAYWWLDRYADFDAAQAPRAREALASWFAWHRAEQLPDYVRLLQRAQDEVARPATADQLCSWYDEGRSRARTAFEAAVPAIAELAVTLSPAQIEHIEQRQAKVNVEHREETLQADPVERLKALVKRTTERAEMLYGPLDASQRERLTAALRLSPYDAERSYAQRRRNQQDAVQILRQAAGTGSAGQPAAQAALAAYAKRLMRPADPEQARHFEQVVRHNCGMLAGLHNSSTPEQRRRAGDKFGEWIADLRALIAEARR